MTFPHLLPVTFTHFLPVMTSCALDGHPPTPPRGAHLHQLWGVIRADLAPGCITAVVQQHCGVDAVLWLALVGLEHQVGPKSENHVSGSVDKRKARSLP